MKADVAVAQAYIAKEICNMKLELVKNEDGEIVFKTTQADLQAAVKTLAFVHKHEVERDLDQTEKKVVFHIDADRSITLSMQNVGHVTGCFIILNDLDANSLTI